MLKRNGAPSEIFAHGTFIADMFYVDPANSALRRRESDESAPVTAMGPLKRIVVGHDLGPVGDIAFRSALVLAKRCHAALKVIHVIEPLPLYEKFSHPFHFPPGPEDMARSVGETLERRVGSFHDLCIELHQEVCTGKPFIELIVASRAWRADLIVVGGPAEPPTLTLGSTRERVIRKALVPVLVTPKTLLANAKLFVVPTDFSSGARNAAREALTLAEQFGARVCFLHVLDDYPLLLYADDAFGALPQLSPEDVNSEWTNFLSDLPLGNVVWEQQTLEGRSAHTIVEHAAARHADLIVMGTHGRSALESMLLGSVTENVTRSARCPVLTVRPEAFTFSL
jgi:nucleotide-binding universal stress UspA family protein